MNKISEDIMDVLKASIIENDCLYLPPELDRKTYLQVNEVLENAGGKWNRSLKAHVFPTGGTAKLMGSMESGITVNEKKLYQFFETPASVIAEMLKLAKLDKKQLSILEPSAGHGAICDAILKEHPKMAITCADVDPAKCKVMLDKGYTINCIDFLRMVPDKIGFDRVIMNPPFTKGQDAHHVFHAFSFVKAGGRLVSVMSASVKFNHQIKYQKIRDLVDTTGDIIDLPDVSIRGHPDEDGRVPSSTLSK